MDMVAVLNTNASTRGLPHLGPLNHRRVNELTFNEALVEVTDIVSADCWAVVFETPGFPRRVIYNLFEEWDSPESQQNARKHLMNNPGYVLSLLRNGTKATMYLGEWAYIILESQVNGKFRFDENSVYIID